MIFLQFYQFLHYIFLDLIIRQIQIQIFSWWIESLFFVFWSDSLYLQECFWLSVQLLSRVQLLRPLDCSTPGLPVHHQHPEFTQTHVHWVSDAIQASHPLSFWSPPLFSLPQHQGLFQLVSSSYQVAKVLEFQLQHHSFQWIFRTYFL